MKLLKFLELRLDSWFSPGLANIKQSLRMKPSAVPRAQPVLLIVDDQPVYIKLLYQALRGEYQVVVEMPAGSALEDTAATLQDLGAYLAKQPEVLNLQGYAGTASPITFNGLVRQYYLRADAEQGDLQVNLVDKHHRSDKSHVIAQHHRPALEKIAAAHGARVKVVEVPPGPPVMSPLVAEVYGPDEAGRQQLAARIAKAFAATPDIVGTDTSLREDAPRTFLRVQRQRAESLGIPVAAVAQTVQGALSGMDAAYLHDGQSKYPIPVRLQLPRESQVGLDALLALPMRAANGQLVPLSELVRVEKAIIDKPLFTKDLQGVSYVFGDMAGKLDSPLYGLFAIRPKLQDAALPGTGDAYGELEAKAADTTLPKTTQAKAKNDAKKFRARMETLYGLVSDDPETVVAAQASAQKQLDDVKARIGAKQQAINEDGITDKVRLSRTAELYDLRSELRDLQKFVDGFGKKVKRKPVETAAERRARPIKCRSRV